MKITSDQLRRQEKAKWGVGHIWDWINTKMIDIYFYIGGHQIVNSQ